MATGHDKIEKNIGLMIVLILLVVSVGGLVQIVPLFFQTSTTEAVAGLEPYTPLRLAGRDVYIREGCYLCHSQMIRPFRAETERYGHYSVAGEYVYDHPCFDRGALTAQQRLGAIQGTNRIWYCGSYFGYGFHEDAFTSGLDVATALGADVPWSQPVRKVAA